jgi:hypothetical protein
MSGILLIRQSNRPSSFLCAYAGFGRSLNSSQVRFTAITEATGSCTLEATPLLQINNTTISIVLKVFICPEVKLSNFLRKQGIIWAFNIVMCKVVRVTRMTGSSSGDWIY